MKYGYPNDLRFSEHGSPVKVISANGKVHYEEATYWSHWQDVQKRGRKRKQVRAGK